MCLPNQGQERITETERISVNLAFFPGEGVCGAITISLSAEWIRKVSKGPGIFRPP